MLRIRVAERRPIGLQGVVIGGVGFQAVELHPPVADARIMPVDLLRRHNAIEVIEVFSVAHTDV